MTRIDWFHSPGKTIKGEHLPGVADAAEIGMGGKNAERGGQRHAQLLQADGNFSGQDGSR